MKIISVRSATLPVLLLPLAFSPFPGPLTNKR